MLRRSLIPLLMLGILLGACQSNAPASPPPTAQLVTPSPQRAAVASLTAAVASLTAAADPAAPVTGAPPGCTVVSPEPTPGPTEASLFPPISDKDWALGVPTATVSIIEYSDFQ